MIAASATPNPRPAPFEFRRVTLETAPYPQASSRGRGGWLAFQGWPCAWVQPSTPPAAPYAVAFMLNLELNEALHSRVHVTADERYELFINGQRVARGSERGDPWHWPFESYDLHLQPGSHVICALVWVLGPLRPWAQVTVKPGLLFSPETPEAIRLLGSGVAPWRSQILNGLCFFDASSAAGRNPGDLGAGAGLELDARDFPWGFEIGAGDWSPVVTADPGNDGFRLHVTQPEHLLFPATLPAMLERPLRGLRVRSVDAGENPLFAPEDALETAHQTWRRDFENGLGFTVPANTTRRVLIDFENYHCFYPELELAGGRDAVVTLGYSEALVDAAGEKRHRDEVLGKRFVGLQDTFISDGLDHTYAAHWWRAGRYLQLHIRTRAEPLTVKTLRLLETGYPLELESEFRPDSAELEQILRVSFHTLRQCAHETFMDCPYFEQLQYIGDTRLQALIGYVSSRDDRLTRKALTSFERSRINPSGLPTSCAPAASASLIPPFALWWVAMVHDYALWRDDKAFVSSLMPGVRAVMERFQTESHVSGLIRNPQGWNFQDWVEDWPGGVPRDAGDDLNAVLNWQVALVWLQLSELERFVDEPELAARAGRLAHAQAQRTTAAFWNPKRGLFADDTAHRHFSQHAQCLAILSGLLAPAREQTVFEAMRATPDVAQTSLYFSHYLFETCQRLGRGEVILERWRDWTACLEDDLKTFPEHFGEPRSDCHAWSAHPLYHYASSILGVRPASFGFASVRIAPQLGPLERAAGKIVHPKGLIEVRLERQTNRLTAEIVLPDGLEGQFVHLGLEHRLKSGSQTLHLPNPRRNP